jgi:hypothetical protein
MGSPHVLAFVVMALLLLARAFIVVGTIYHLRRRKSTETS